MEVSYRLQDLVFEWDGTKASSNVEKHGVTFEEAAEVFLDPFRAEGDASVGGEERSFVIGFSMAQHVLLVVFVERLVSTRIISARPATRAERKRYERGG